MRVDNEKELEMNKYEKMSWEIIKDKKKVKLDFEKTYIISFGFFMVLSMIFGMFLRNIELERYLEDEKRKRKDFINEKNNNIDVSDDK